MRIAVQSVLTIFSARYYPFGTVAELEIGRERSGAGYVAVNLDVLLVPVSHVVVQLLVDAA